METVATSSTLTPVLIDAATLQKAHRISAEGQDRAGKPLKVLSPNMQKVFGDFGELARGRCQVEQEVLL